MGDRVIQPRTRALLRGVIHPPILDDGHGLDGERANLRITHINERKLFGADEFIEERNVIVGTLR